MRLRTFLLMLCVFWCCTAAASEPAADTLPPELVRLREDGRLTVRALWAWKLVPESTARMALELRNQGLDLLAADHGTVTSWLADAEAGKLSLNETQRTFLNDLAVLMRSEGQRVPARDGGAAVGATAEPSPKAPADVPAVLAGLEDKAGQGDPGAKAALAMAARTGLDGRVDPVRSVTLLEEAAAAGDADAMALLADEYEWGLWVPRDAEKAGQLRRKAAEAGSQLAKWGEK